MPQTSNRFFDDISRLMTDAAGLADGSTVAISAAQGRLTVNGKAVDGQEEAPASEKPTVVPFPKV